MSWCKSPRTGRYRLPAPIGRQSTEIMALSSSYYRGPEGPIDWRLDQGREPIGQPPSTDLEALALRCEVLFLRGQLHRSQQLAEELLNRIARDSSSRAQLLLIVGACAWELRRRTVWRGTFERAALLAKNGSRLGVGVSDSTPNPRAFCRLWSTIRRFVTVVRDDRSDGTPQRESRDSCATHTSHSRDSKRVLERWIKPSGI